MQGGSGIVAYAGGRGATRWLVTALVTVVPVTIAGPSCTPSSSGGESPDGGLRDGAFFDAIRDGTADAGVDAMACMGGLARCEGACVDTGNDPDNCGVCGAKCADGLVCSGGACVVTCALGETLCAVGSCANLDSDPMNCGVCGHVCGSKIACAGGKCQGPDAGPPDAGPESGSADATSESGSADAASESGPKDAAADSGSVDAMPEASGDASCQGADLGTDPNDCGYCGHSCLGGTCVGGDCQPFVVASLAATGFTPAALTLDSASVYFTANAGISASQVDSCPLGGCEGTPLVLYTPTGGQSLMGVAAFQPTGELYVVAQSYELVLRVSEVDAGSGFMSYANGLTNPAAIAIDDANATAYYGSGGDVDYSSLPTFTGTPSPSMQAIGSAQQIVVDATGVYAAAPSVVARCALQTNCGSSFTTIASGLNGAMGVFSDGTNVWFTESGTTSSNGNVYSCPNTGCAFPVVAFAPGRNGPHGIVVDAPSGFVYWTEPAAGQLLRCPTSGCAGAPIIVVQAGAPTALAQDANALYWTDPAAEAIYGLAK